MKSIGIDIGTTSICGVLIDGGTGETLDTITVPNDAFITTPNSWEKIQDAERVCDIARSVLTRLLRGGMGVSGSGGIGVSGSDGMGVSGSDGMGAKDGNGMAAKNGNGMAANNRGDVSAIGVTGQMHGIVYLNQHGEAVSPLYTWQDMRGNLPYQQTTYAEMMGGAAGYGHITHGYNVINGLVPSSMRCFCTIADYFALKLCRKQSPLIHTSNAASFGLFDIGTHTFNCEFDGDVTDEYAVLGTYKNIPVAIAIGDNQAGFLGSGGTADSVLVNIGTGSQISVIADEVKTNAEMNGLEQRPYVRGQCLSVGCALCGGRAYALLKNFFDDIYRMATGVKHPDMYECMDQLMQTTQSDLTTDLIIETQFAGSRQYPGLRARIHNLGTDNFTAKDFIIGLLHGIVDELHTIYRQNNLSAEKLIASGNGIRKNAALRRVLEATFGRPAHIPVCAEEAAYGAALFALVSVGFYGDITQAAALVRYIAQTSPNF